MRRSLSASSTSTSSASGRTATVTAEVWMRPWVSVTGTRCTRCTPPSNLRRLKAPFPTTRTTSSLTPPPPGLLELRALPGELRELAPVGDDGRVRDQALQLLVAPLDLGEAVEHALTHERGASASPTPRIRRAGDPRPRQAGAEPEPLRLRPYLRWKRSTRPAVSTSFCLPVKNGWHAEQISTW